MVTRNVQATSDRETLVLGGGAVLLAGLALGGVWTSLHLAAYLDHQPAPTADPLRLVLQLVKGEQPWTGTATGIAVGLAVLLVVLTFGGILLWPSSKRMRPDRSARHMAGGADLAHLREAGAAAKAKRLGTRGVGLPLGKTVKGQKMLYSSWEDMLILIAGPRTQKTTAYAVPTILAAPGACLATSNKRDLVDATSGPRSARGKIWVFDPQHVANAPVSFWWDPLSYIAGSETRAEKLAGQFVTSSRPAGARTDAYFDGEAENLIGLLLLAASLAEQPITTVYTWLTRPTSDAPVDILKDHHGYELQQQSLYALSHLPDKQREGVYGTARSLMGFLRNRDIVAWVTPAPDRRQFNPRRFARSHDTLYPLSREGEGSVAPLVAALTLAVLEALEERATASDNGRLPIPFVAVLDEAANICRLRNLDSQYSHYGSRGILMLTILQNWAQGAQAWGDHGIEKLWSAANVKIYGGGVDDDKFLRRLSDLIGSFEHISRSQSVNRGSRTLTRNVAEKTILTVAELRALPAGRAVAFPSGTPAVLIEPQPWFTGKDAPAIQASIDKAHDPEDNDRPEDTDGKDTHDRHGRRPLRRHHRRPQPADRPGDDGPGHDSGDGADGGAGEPVPARVRLRDRLRRRDVRP